MSIVNTLSPEILDQIPEKKRGTGAVICMCPAPGALRENVLQLLFSMPSLYCFTARIIYNGVAP